MFHMGFITPVFQFCHLANCTGPSDWPIVASTVGIEEEGGHTIGEFMAVVTDHIVFPVRPDVSDEVIFQALNRAIAIASRT